MLQLSRKAGQEIRIGENIIVRVLGYRRGQVDLGISAPPHVPIYRSEVWARIEAERRAAGGSQSNE